jgi:hypothetical protein
MWVVSAFSEYAASSWYFADVIVVLKTLLDRDKTADSDSMVTNHPGRIMNGVTR